MHILYFWFVIFNFKKKSSALKLMLAHYYFPTDPTDTKTFITLWDQFFYSLLPVLSVTVLQLFPTCNHL